MTTSTAAGCEAKNWKRKCTRCGKTPCYETTKWTLASAQLYHYPICSCFLRNTNLSSRALSWFNESQMITFRFLPQAAFLYACVAMQRNILIVIAVRLSRYMFALKEIDESVMAVRLWKMSQIVLENFTVAASMLRCINAAATFTWLTYWYGRWIENLEIGGFVVNFFLLLDPGWACEMYIWNKLVNRSQRCLLLIITSLGDDTWTYLKSKWGVARSLVCTIFVFPTWWNILCRNVPDCSSCKFQVPFRRNNINGVNITFMLWFPRSETLSLKSCRPAFHFCKMIGEASQEMDLRLFALEELKF